MNIPFPKHLGPFRLAVVTLLSVHAMLLIWVDLVKSPTLDEVGHLPAGISHWISGRFDLYRVNPPLVRSLAAVPVLLSGVETSWTRYSRAPSARPEFTLGEEFVRVNGARSFWLFTMARWACIPLSLIGGWVCYRWAKELYGSRSGLLALTLWCFSPTVIGNAAMITPDAGAAALGALAAYTFWRWLRMPTWRRALTAGLALGVAELTKTTWIVLFGLWPSLWLLWLLVRHGKREPCLSMVCETDGATGTQVDGGAEPSRGKCSTARQGAQVSAIIIVAIYVLNLGYGFEGTFKRLGDYTFISKTLAGPGPLRPTGGNRFAGSVLGRIPMPVPENYFRGIDVQKHDFEQGLWTYLRGEQRRQGWWYYYIYAALVKEPIGTWLLAAVSLIMTFRTRYKFSGVLDELVLWVPALTVFALVSSQTGINRHYRYVLPAVPFALIWMSKAGSAIDLRSWRSAAGVIALTAWSIASSLMVYPHSLSYFNEAVGGPAGGPAHLLDSNIDWGQDLLVLRRWLDAHPEVRSLKLAYFGAVPPSLAGIKAPLPPLGLTRSGARDGPHDMLGPQPGWFAVSVNYVYGYRHNERDDDEFGYFRFFKVYDMAGYSIYIYHIEDNECKRIRKIMKL